ncbi:MAG: discoidin domain-containing protein, partial [Limisphaerales bacterium]
LGFPAAASEPSKLLKGFQKNFLSPGQTQRVTFNLNWEDLANWDATARGWIVTPGQFQVMVGASSRDIRLAGSFTVASPIPASDLANAALHQTVTVSSTLSTNTPGSAAVDGDTISAWSSLASDPQWISVDLGMTRDLNRVRLHWNTNYASSYAIQFSSDGTNWTDVFNTNNDRGGVEDILVSSRGRYVRIYGTAQGLPGAGYSLSELEVHSQPQRPFGGTIRNLPGQIQAEDYDTGGEGVAYNDETQGNSGGAFRTDDVDIESATDAGGGYDVGWTDPGERLEYTVNVPDPSAIYSIKARVASTAASQMRVRLDGTVLGTFQIPDTGGWQNWQTVTLTNIPVTGCGSKALRLEMLTGGFNVNWIEFDRAQICGANNIALNQPASASSVQSTSDSAADAFDGDLTTRWSSQFSDPQWITVDLGSVQNIARVRLDWETAFSQSFALQFSIDSNNWTTAYSTTNGSGGIADLGVTGSARYVRLNSAQRGTAFGDSLWEFEIYPTLAPALAITLARTNVMISWPASAINWSLETAPALEWSDSLSAITTATFFQNSEYIVTNPIGASAQFYRLESSP